MVWQDTLLSNLLVWGILFTVFAIAYCKIKKITMIDLFKEIREILSPSEIIE